MSNSPQKQGGRFQKGQSGNPKGRPPAKQALTDILRAHGEAIPEGDKLTRNKLLAEKLWNIALEGDMVAIKYLYDRLDGKPRESMDLNHSGEIETQPDWSRIPTEELKRMEAAYRRASGSGSD